MNARFLGGRGWVLSVALCLLGAVAQAQPSSEVELEFWRAAERVATPDAYRAYLSAFPTGVFAPLAQAALAKASTGTAGMSPGADGAILQAFREDAPNSGALTFLLGDRFAGPGFVVAGWGAARKQLVLPHDEWIALAARDFTLEVPGRTFNLAAQRAAMSSIVFGRFEGGRLATLLRFTFSGKPMETPAWPDYDGCLQGPAAPLLASKSVPTRYGMQCQSVGSHSSWRAALGPDGDETDRSLRRLGATATAEPVSVSIVSSSEGRWGASSVRRIDLPPAGSRAPATDWAGRMSGWLDGYRPLVAAGASRSLDATELSANARPQPSSEALAVPVWQGSR